MAIGMAAGIVRREGSKDEDAHRRGRLSDIVLGTTHCFVLESMLCYVAENFFVSQGSNIMKREDEDIIGVCQ